MIRHLQLTLSVGLLSTAFVATGYDVETHQDISRVAANSSVLRLQPAALAELGLRSLDLDDPSQTFPSFGGPAMLSTQLTVGALIRLGSAWEDNLSIYQPLRHFYDPVNNSPLNLGGLLGTSVSINSPDWALEDLGTYGAPFATQDFSYRDAREYFYNALTNGSEIQRKQFFGATFQTLGHVMHHLQDMAQPQHVRDDPHCDIKACAMLATALLTKQLYVPSLYEEYTNDVRGSLPFSGPGSAAVYSRPNLSGGPFRTPRQFWRTTPPGSAIDSGKGISEYTNRNFFSAGTIYRYNSPVLPEISLPSEVIDIRQLLPGTTLNGVLYFYSTLVTDALSGQTQVNSRALSNSIFDLDVQQIYQTANPGLYFAMNKFTFDAAHQFLIPRAVGYSAGLINYFFRGQMQISLPDEGVYGIIDHNEPASSDPVAGGFPRVKLELQNVTPAGTDGQGNPIVEPMMEGTAPTLVAVAKFHRNNCYRPDLSGEYGSPGNDWNTCRSPSEEIVVSVPAPVPTGINSSPQPVTFTFPNKIPISATDLYLQVVYRGPLGDETDAVVVTTKDISEPHYLYNYSRWDQYLYAPYPSVDPGPYTWAQWCSQGGYASQADCNTADGQRVKIQYSRTSDPIPGYDPADNPVVPPLTWANVSLETPFTPVVIMPAPVGTLARVAVLTDASPSNAALWVSEYMRQNSLFMWNEGIAGTTINQLDPVTGTLTPSVTYLPGRGVFLPAEENFLLTDGTAPSIPPLLPAASQINFE